MDKFSLEANGYSRSEVNKFIDDAQLAGLKQINIIHGKGTGQLSIIIPGCPGGSAVCRICPGKLWTEDHPDGAGRWSLILRKSDAFQRRLPARPDPPHEIPRPG